MSQHRKDLPMPIPDRLRSLPVQNGFPVPWFVAKVGDDYDFRIIDPEKIYPATKKRLCWICGQKLGAYLAFPIGPMCAINRTISEPPSHRECAEWSIKACPFLAQRQDECRETHLPASVKEPAGISLKWQPGAVCLWVTKSYRVDPVANGVLFALGDPTEVQWFKAGVRLLEKMRQQITPLLPR
jgi:hypothetical protein